MATIIESKFKVIEATGEEFLSIGMGGGDLIDDGIIKDGIFKGVHKYTVQGGIYLCCDYCDKSIDESERCYYVAVLNRILCEKCFKTWHSNAVYYNADRPIENKNFSFYARKMGLLS